MIMMIQTIKESKTENLFNRIDKDYYKPIKTKSTFNSNYKEYKSRGDNDENFSP